MRLLFVLYVAVITIGLVLMLWAGGVHR